MRLGFVGTGAITSAIITGLNSIEVPQHTTVVSPRNAEHAAALARRFPGVSVADSNQEVLDRCDIAVLAVRPQVFHAVISELRFRPEHHVISLVAAFSRETVLALVSPAAQVARAVPLPSTAERRCPTAIYPNDAVAAQIFDPLGAAFAVDSEAAFDAFATATAAMAAYFAFADSLASWLMRHGISPGQSRDYIGRVLSGLAHTALESPGRSFHELAHDHATPGGMNEQVVAYLRKQGVFDTVSEALDAILRRVKAQAE